MGHQSYQRRVLLAVIAFLAVGLIAQTINSSVQWIHKPFPGFFVHENLTVGPYFLPQWSGSVAGLKSLDRVIAVNGQVLRQRVELYEIVKNSPAGSNFHYRIIRNSQILELTVPSMNFLLHDWFLSFGVYVVMGVAFVLIGIAPYFFRASSPAALPLCFMVLTVFIWFDNIRFHDYRNINKGNAHLWFDADAKRWDSPGIAAENGSTAAAIAPGLSRRHLRNFVGSWLLEQRHVFWPDRKLDSCFPGRLFLCLRWCTRLFGDYLVGASGSLGKFGTIKATGDFRRRCAWIPAPYAWHRPDEFP